MLKICIYIGINAHVTPVTHRQTDTHVKVEQYSAEAESAKIYLLYQKIVILASYLFLRMDRPKGKNNNGILGIQNFI